MKAVRMHGFGGVEQLIYEDMDEPVLSQPAEAIVKLRAAAINHIDIWNRLGATGMVTQLPHILGADGAGVVVEVGGQVQNIKKGDAVCLYPPVGCGRCEFCRRGEENLCVGPRFTGWDDDGGYAEYAVVPSSRLVPVPKNIDSRSAAASAVDAARAPRFAPLRGTRGR